MFKLIFVYLLLIHILGDYYFQTEKLASDKKQSVKKQFEHSAIYLCTGIIGIVPIITLPLFYAALVLSVSHFIIDIVKYGYIKGVLNEKYTAEKERKIYLMDQFIHMTCIFIIALFLTSNGIKLSLMPSLEHIIDIIGISARELLYWITLFLFIWKPANITIKQLLCLYKPNEDECSEMEESPESTQKNTIGFVGFPTNDVENGITKEPDNVKKSMEEKKEVEESSKKTGGFIGLLERLIILILLSISQYSAIGLVLTAKSIARYNKISDNKEFAEYYLLGTLLSTVIVIGAYLIVV